jgi:hypothetical protein
MSTGPATAVTQCQTDIGKIPCSAPDGGVPDAGAADGGASNSCKEAIVYVP